MKIVDEDNEPLKQKFNVFRELALIIIESQKFTLLCSILYTLNLILGIKLKFVCLLLGYIESYHLKSLYIYI